MSFKAAQASIEKKEGVSAKSAGAILASGARKASPAAKKANPNLKKVLPAKKPPTKAPRAAWQGVADQMLGNVPATGVGSPKAGNGSR
jgi:hypothetical protein